MLVTQQSTEAIEIFFAYSHQDKRKQRRLKNHLRGLQNEGVKMYWHKHQKNKGQEWNSEIPQCLYTAHMIGLLVSPDFPDSDTSWDRDIVNLAMHRHRQEEIRVIPIRVGSVDLQGELYDGLRALPSEDQPVDSRYWKNQNEAFVSITRDIKLEINNIKLEINKRQEYQKKIQAYKNAYSHEIQQRNPLSDQALDSLNYFRKSLDITEEEAAQIEDETNQEMATEKANNKRKVNQSNGIIAIVAAITLFSILFSAAKLIYYLNRSAEDFFKEGITHSSNNNFKEAIQDYTQAIQRDSNKHNYYEKRGNAYLRDKNWQKAIEDYTQSIRINPNSVDAYRHRGEARSKLGDIQGAIQDLRKAASFYQAQGKTYDYKAVQKRIIQLLSQEK